MLSKQIVFGVLAPAFVMCWIATMLYSAVAGKSGYGELSRLEAEAELSEAELDALRERRAALQQRADQLSSKSLDPDLVDERIRSVLGYSKDGDRVISRQALDQLARRQAGQSQ